ARARRARACRARARRACAWRAAGPRGVCARSGTRTRTRRVASADPLSRELEEGLAVLAERRAFWVLVATHAADDHGASSPSRGLLAPLSPSAPPGESTSIHPVTIWTRDPAGRDNPRSANGAPDGL